MELRKCKYCGKEFMPRSSRAIYCKGPHYMTCPICNKVYQVTNNDKLKFPPTACSYNCRTILRTKTSLEKYGCIAPGNNPEARKKASETMMKNLGVPYAMMSKEVQKKSKKTLLEKYGVDNVGKNEEIRNRRMETEKSNHGGVLAFNTPESYEHRRKTVYERFGCEVLSSSEIREKIKKIMKEKYGAEHMMQVPEFKEKQQASMFKHYGVKSAFASPEIRKKCEQTMLERYGVTNAAYSEELMAKAEQTMLEKYGKSCRKSKINEHFSELLSNQDIYHETEHFIYGKWYDICLENQKIFIEINPTYTHNVIGNHWGRGLPIDYHIAKTNLAIENGYRCIHVWDWDDWDKIIDMVDKKEIIYARKCKLFKLYQNVTNEFLEKNDIHGKCRGNLLCLGLIHNDEIVQVMTFGKPRFNKNYSTEMLRLCTKRGFQIIGGASKLFSFALKYFDLDNMITYCDLSKFTGNIYEKLGMKFIYQSNPREIWSKDKQFVTSNLLRQKTSNRIAQTERNKQMLENGWLPVYDCGQAVYEWKK